MSAKTPSNSSQSRAGSISAQSDVSDKNATINTSNGHQNEARKTTVAHQRYDSYRVAIYGTAAEKEAYKQQIRSQLKDQVRAKDDLHRKQLVDRVAESDTAVANDQKSKMEDNSTKKKKANYLKQFSDGNKKIMEEKEQDLRRTREAESELERKLLTVNPINWNMTLH